MKILLLISDVAADAPPDELDTLVQVEEIHDALITLGHEVTEARFSLSLETLSHVVRQFKPDVVFNMVEAIDASSELVHLIPAALTRLGVPYTGASAAALLKSNDKVLSKQMLCAAGLATAPWITLKDGSSDFDPSMSYVLKPNFENGSNNLEMDAVRRFANVEALRAELSRREELFEKVFFAEQYLPGREFNLSLLEIDGVVRHLPLAEVTIPRSSDNPFGILSYQAKWNPPSEDFFKRIRSFEKRDLSSAILAEIERAGKICWDLFGLSGVARLDIRLDAAARPSILEVNANPALGSDGGLFAACKVAGISYLDLMGALLTSSLSAWRDRHATWSGGIKLHTLT